MSGNNAVFVLGADAPRFCFHINGSSFYKATGVSLYSYIDSLFELEDKGKLINMLQDYFSLCYLLRCSSSVWSPPVFVTAFPTSNSPFPNSLLALLKLLTSIRPESVSAWVAAITWHYSPLECDTKVLDACILLSIFWMLHTCAATPYCSIMALLIYSSSADDPQSPKGSGWEADDLWCAVSPEFV